MRKNLLLMLALLLCSAAKSAEQTNVVDYVNPLVGTQSSFAISNGNTYPAIAMPWGMNFWTPQTGRMGDGWQYTYDAGKIRGLKQTHQPSPWINDYGQFSILPTTGKPVFDEDERASWFSHKSEVARPYYYSVYLADYNVTAEIAPTERAAIMQFTYPQTDSANVVIDAFDRGSYIKIVPNENKIIGYSTRNSGGVPEGFKNYFVIIFDRPFTSNIIYDNKQPLVAGNEIASTHAGVIVSFKTTKRGEKINARIASSFISAEQAELNLKELGSNTFTQVADKGKQRWNDVLGRIEVKDRDNIDHLRTFYSCLYRSLLFPRSLYEVNSQGEIVHYSPYNGKVLPGYMFTDTGFWDTFRALFPLLNLVYPDENAKMQAGLVNAYNESGFLPEWASPGHRDCMVGNNSASIVADAYLSGLRGYDINALWQAVTHGANAEHPTINSTGRKGFEYYNKLGYVPYDVDINENVARTLEYAYDDWCIYQLGKALGKPEKEIEVYKKHALNYKNVFDTNLNLMRGKLANGKFMSPYNPFKWGDAFTEGNGWQWNWAVFHDPQGLINLMGGKQTFNQMMDSVFNLAPIYDDSYYGGTIHEIREMQIMNMGQYAHGNQPIQHMIYLYDYSGEPWKTQYWVREAMNRLYSANPDGYCGDEDNGQTSAWYVFSALGFYPVCPGSGQYAIGSPYFKDVTVHLNNGNKVEITSNNAGRYVQSLTQNGKVWDKNYLNLTDLKGGVDLNFNTTTTPNKQRGTGKADVPYSMSYGK